MRASTLLLALTALSASAQTVVKPNLIASDLPFTPDGKIESIESRLLTQVESHKVESGSLSGVAYRFYYSDGSGTFAGTPGNKAAPLEPMDSNWSVACKKDPINDKRHCYMQMRDLWIFVYPKSRISISVGTDLFPRSTAAIRIDQGKPFETAPRDEGYFSPSVSAKLIPLLGNARTVTTRYMKWPERIWIDKQWEIYGFKETFQYLSWAVERIK